MDGIFGICDEGVVAHADGDTNKSISCGSQYFIFFLEMGNAMSFAFLAFWNKQGIL